MQTINGYYRIPTRDASLDTMKLYLAKENAERTCNVISIKNRMEYDIFACLQKPVDLNYRLSDWPRNTSVTQADLEDLHLGAGANEPDDDDGGYLWYKRSGGRGGCQSLRQLKRLQDEARNGTGNQKKASKPRGGRGVCKGAASGRDNDSREG